MRIKLCGLTRARDVEAVAELGASHIGFVLAPDTPRTVDAGSVRDWARELPRTTTPVLVFRPTDTASILAACEQSGVSTVQLHGFGETNALELERRGLCVHRVRSLEPLGPPLAPLEPAPRADRPWHVDVAAGGSGLPFDWLRLRPHAPAHVFVAGGITPANLPALLPLEPWGIDVSSGVESSPGIKDRGLLQELFACARA